MKRSLLLIAALCATTPVVHPQEAPVAAPESIVSENVPSISATLAEKIGRYTENRDAFQTDWHPARREMVIGTRFGNSYQAHVVKMPGGARQQLTFFSDPVYGASYYPKDGNYLLFQKDVGGGEWFQYFRYDLESGDSRLLTDGKSRNTSAHWSSGGDLIAYVSTRRNKQDTDLWVMNPASPRTDHLVTQLSGGGWEPQDWSPDDKKILLLEGISVNETYLWIVDAATGEKTELTPRKTEEQVAYGSPRFSKDGKGVYVTPDLSWDIDEFQQSWDGKWIAFLSNEDGLSKLHILDSATGKERTVPKLPVGVMSGLIWHRNNRDLGYGLQTGSAQGDCYSLDVAAGTIERWTTSETAVRPAGLRDAELVRWKTFDGRNH